ncbi:MAG: ABC transporter permease, partial [Bacteroidales bacterium]|nr:ABC transporter permease [Bacteroidales bacterium]
MNTIHLKFIFKNLKKSGKITVFNLIGLSVSFAAFMLISIYVFNEFTYDRFNKDYERIYRLNMVKESNGQKQVSTRLPNPLADDIRDNLSEFESQCSFAWGPMLYVKESDQLAHYEIATRAVDSTFTDIFTLRIKSGNQHPLRTKNSIIISEKTAIKVFGDENPVGKTLLANYTEPYIIEAIFYDLPENSSFKYDAFCSYPTTEWIDYWSEYSFIHFFKLLPNADMSLINSKIQDIQSVKNLVNNYPDTKISFTFTPLKDYHFDSQGGYGNLV